jgi:glycosyltransferase involved in cell wall biosynthesis
MIPTISIAIPCYKSERYIRTTIESALAQSVPASEVLISDDNSPDRSYEIIREYEGIHGVRIVRPNHRLALGEHYRFLLDRARGDYVCFLSADDALMPSFIGTMQDVVRSDPAIGMVAAACLECDSSLVPLRVRGMGLPRGDLFPPDGFCHFARGCSYTISTSILSRRLLLATEPLPVEATLSIDWYWALLLGLHAKVRFLREPLGYYRFHDENNSHSGAERWRKEAQEMLRFLIASADADSGPRRDLQETLRQFQTAATRPVRPSSTIWKISLKSLVKTGMAFRYRALPPFLTMAEQGVSSALTKPKT